jgi:hypothetical protein
MKRTAPSLLALIVLTFIAALETSVMAAELRATVTNRVAEKWTENKLKSAPKSSDSEFLRRVYLDLIGTIPTHDETLAFLDDATNDKRAKLIDRLLEDPRFALHQSDVWDMTLFGRNSPGYGTRTRDQFRDWLKKQFAENVPYDQWVKTLLVAEGDSYVNGAPMWYAQYSRKPEDATEALTQTFLGIQLQCARCHDHPFEEWTQLDFYGMAAFLARLEVIQMPKKDRVSVFTIGEKNAGDILFTGPVTDQVAGKKGEPVKPKFLLGEKLVEPEHPADFKEARFVSNKKPPAPKFSRKNALADWISTADNPYFARAVANRVWAQFMGRGIVHPVDNMSPANAPTHPKLLDELAEAMKANKFDLKWYIRELCNSDVYQLSAQGPSTQALPEWFVQAQTRPLAAEELAEAWRVATNFDASASHKRRKSTDRFRPLTGGYMMRFFGTPTNGTGDFAGGMQEHLYLNNGQIGSLIGSGEGGLYDELLKSTDELGQKVDRLYLSILSRRAETPEREKIVEFLSAGKGDREVSDRFREVIWALLCCSEFRFNH